MSGVRYSNTSSTGVNITYTCRCGVTIECAGEKLLETVVANHLGGAIHADNMNL